MKSIKIVGCLLVVAGATLLTTATSYADHISARASATIVSCTDGTTLGRAFLSERSSTEGIKLVDVTIQVRAGTAPAGLAPGRHAVHFHEVGNCTPCAAAGSHLDLGPFGNNVPVTANHPYHSGDLINIRVGSREGFLQTTSSRFTLSPGNLSLFSGAVDDGASIIIHALPDLYCPDPTDPNCAGGGRTACGILRLID